MPRPAFRFKAMSVTMWLIIVNFAIFFLGQIAPIPHDFVYGYVPASSATPQMVTHAFDHRPANIAAGEPWLKKVTDPSTGQLIKLEQIRSYPLLEGLGHFSLFMGFWPRMEVWRVITFQFIHANFLHVFFNMFGLYIFGWMVEQYLGRKRYLAFYLICGICGALMYLFLSLLASLGVPLPGSLAQMSNPATSLVGASAGVFGVIMACAHIAPNRQLMLIFPPIPIKMKFLAYGYVGIAAYNLISGGANAGGDAAHIGGAIAGFFFIRNAHLLREFFAVGRPRSPGGSSRKTGRTQEKGVNRTEIDRVLAKVHDRGIHSLSDREKKLLERASRDQRDNA